MDDVEEKGAGVKSFAGDANKSEQIQKQLSVALGQVRAEYSTEDEIFRMFSQPVYWGQLVGTRPCFLVGGRGTGKTTALRGLTYQGQFALLGSAISEWAAVGSYMRIESNVVSSFRGRRLDDEQWDSLFGHFLNLQLSIRMLSFIEWRRDVLHTETSLDEDEMSLFRRELGISDEVAADRIKHELRLLSADLERGLNGPRDGLLSLPTSLLGQPVGYLSRAMQLDEELRGVSFTFCIDEYENLSPSQQRVLNTLIKHVGDHPFTFKIGVRDSARLDRSTLAPGQMLMEPADFSTIDIVENLKEQDFDVFAEKICLGRIGPLLKSADQTLRGLLPGLSVAEEARLLGVDRLNATTQEKLVENGASTVEVDGYKRLSIIEKALVSYWAESKGSQVTETLREALDQPEQWTIRSQNYGYAMLFSLRRRVRGTRKYFVGWSLFMQLADGNIRYALQLLLEALMLHISSGSDLAKPVSFENQTTAASRVGGRALREIQGVSTRGGELTSLALGLGRVFQVMAAEPHGHTPEVNQFRVSRGELVVDDEALDDLLSEGVAQGCLLAFEGDKRASVSGETKSFDYQLHPIFAPYFVFGHRRKRRMTIRSSDILGLAGENSPRVIRKLLKGRKSSPADLPVQLSIYGDFFDES